MRSYRTSRIICALLAGGLSISASLALAETNAGATVVATNTVTPTTPLVETPAYAPPAAPAIHQGAFPAAAPQPTAGADPRPAWAR